MVALEVEALYAEDARQRMLAGVKAADPGPNLAQGSTGRAAALAGKALRVASGNVKKAKRLKRDAPDLAEKVHTGEIATKGQGVGQQIGNVRGPDISSPKTLDELGIAKQRVNEARLVAEALPPGVGGGRGAAARRDRDEGRHRSEPVPSKCPTLGHFLADDVG